MSDTIKPNPGSPAAISKGCICPRIDNGHGRGYMGGVTDKDGDKMFVVVGNCPMHGEPKP